MSMKPIPRATLILTYRNSRGQAHHTELLTTWRVVAIMNLMYGFHFCVNCGAPLEERLLPAEDRPRLACGRCGYVQYVNPKIVSGTLPIADGKLWLLRRGIEPRYGFWTYPAGFQEWDESTEEAAIRETREELGCEVALDQLLGVYSRAGAPVVNVVYLAHLADTSSIPHTTKEATEVRAFGPEELPWPELAFPSTSIVLTDWLKIVVRY